MEKAKFMPEEIERMIDEEIAQIEAANSAANHTAMQQRKREGHTLPCKLLAWLREKLNSEQ